MGMRERRARQRKSLRQQILDAASELFVRDGFENVSMRRIADKIEYSPTTIYLYFHDKAELLDQVCQETFARLLEVLSKIMDQPGDPLERLARGLHTYIDLAWRIPITIALFS
jgi:AcrR family transcriptional regulator